MAGARSWWDDAVQHGGKELSYLNLYDTEAAWRLVHRFEEPAVVIVKHANPCGVAVAGDITDAYVAANACDPVSAFGGIVAANRPVPAALAEALAPVFTEVVVAPSFADDALSVLGGQEEPPASCRRRPRTATRSTCAASTAACWSRTPIGSSLDRAGWTVPTVAQPDEAEWRELAFAWQVVRRGELERHRAHGRRPGRGHRCRPAEPGRLGPHRRRARPPAARSGAAAPATPSSRSATASTPSPRPASAPSSSPGGSVRDAEVIAAADEHGIAMVFTGERHFRH